MSKELIREQIELTESDTVNFIPSTPRYGSAEFQICFVYKRGKLCECFIDPHQQPDKKGVIYHVDLSYHPNSWQIHSWEFKGMRPPKIWLGFWCKYHKACAVLVYPRDACKMRICKLSTFDIIFDKE